MLIPLYKPVQLFGKKVSVHRYSDENDETPLCQCGCGRTSDLFTLGEIEQSWHTGCLLEAA